MAATEKQNDMLLNVISNPSYTAMDFMDVGLSSENTNMLPYETYRDNEEIQKMFTKNGVFDEQSLKNAYNVASAMMFDMASNTMNQQIAKDFEFQPGSLFALNYDNPKFDTDLTNDTFETEFGKGAPLNPDRMKYGISAVGLQSPNKYSKRELAQMSKTWDSEKQEWIESPEEWFGEHWLENLFNPRIYAKYTKDDPEVQQGEKQEGEYKISPWGTYYTELLNGRPTYNQEIVSYFDTLTKEDSWINRYDFFDSDDKEKSLIGSVFRNLALAAPLAIPGVAPIYLGISTGLQASSLIAGLMKAAVGSDSPILNNISGFLSQFDMSTSDYSQENTWTMENLVNMAGQVFLQLKQQRFLFEQTPKLFGYKQGLDPKAVEKMVAQTRSQYISDITKKFTSNPFETLEEMKGAGMGLKDLIAQKAQASAMKDIMAYEKGAQNIGSILSKAYMTGITTIDSYDEAKSQGAEDWQAALIALGYAAAEYKLLSTSIGEMVMPELRANRRMLQQAIKKGMGISDDMIKEASKSGAMYTREGRNTLAKKLVGLGKDLAEGVYHGQNTIQAIVANGIGEGVEEMSEEALYDMVKTINNTLSWLTGGKFKKLEAWDNMFDRYAMSFVGGAIGGSAFNAATTFRSMKGIENMTNEQAQNTILFMLRDKKRDEIEKVLNKTTFNIKSLKDIQYDDKEHVTVFEEGDEYNNLDKLAKDQFRKVLDDYEVMLESEGFNKSDSELFNSILPDYRYAYINKTMAASLHMAGFQAALNDFANAYKNYNIARNVALTGSKNTPPTDSQERAMSDDEKTKAIAEAEKQLDEARMKVKSYMDGTKAKDFILKGTFEMDKNLSDHIHTISLGSYSRFRKGKDVSELSAKELMDIGKEFEELQKAEGKEQLDESYRYWLAMLKAVNPILSQANEQVYQEMEENKGLMAMLEQASRTADNLAKMFESEEKSGAARASIGDIIQGLASGKLLYINDSGMVDGLDSAHLYGEEGGPGFKKYFEMQVNQEGFEQFKKDNPGLNEADAAEQFDALTSDQKYDLAIRNNNARTGYNAAALEREMLARYVRDYVTQAMQSLEDVAKASYVPSEVKQQALQVIGTLRNLMTNQKYNSGWSDSAVLLNGEIENVSNALYAVKDVFSDGGSEGAITIKDADGNNVEVLTPDVIANVLFEKAGDIAFGGFDNFNDALALIQGFRYNKKDNGDIDSISFDDNISLYGLVNQLKLGENEWKERLDKAINDIDEIIKNETDEDKKKEAEGKKKDLELARNKLFGNGSDNPGLIQMAEELKNIIDSSYKNTLYYDESIMNRLGEIKNEIVEKPYTPIYNLLDKFQIDSKGTKASDVIKTINEKLAAASMDPSVFILTNDEQEAVNNLEEEIEHFSSAIYASREDGSNSVNPFGFVNTYNKLMKDEAGFVQMNTITSDFARQLNAELDSIKSRIKLLKALSVANGTNKLNENKKIEINKAILSYDAISSFVNELAKYNNNAIQKIQSILDDKEYKDKINNYRNLRDSNKTIEPDNDELKKVIGYTIRLERAFHEMMNSGDGGNPISDSVIEKVISAFDPFVHNVESINGDTRGFDMNTSLWYLTSLIAADPIAVSYAATKAYMQLPDIAPTAQQTMALKGLLSFITGRSTYARMSRIFRKSVLDKAKQMLMDKKSADDLNTSLIKLGINDGNIQKYISDFDKLTSGTDEEKENMRVLRKKILFNVANSKSFNIFENMYWIGGIPGSGKTMAVAVAAIKALYTSDGTGDSETEIVSGGRSLIENEGITIVSKKDVADKLKENISDKIREIDKDSIHTYSIEGFLGEYLSITDKEKAERDFEEKDNVTIDTSESGDYIIHSTINKQSDNVPKLILIDEGTLLNQMQMDAIDRMAGETGALVIVFGDEDQIKRMGKIPEVIDGEGTRFSSEEYVYPIAESQFPHSPKIGTSMRSNNTQKEYNRLIIKKKKDEVYRTGKFGDPIKLKFGEKEDGLYGEEVISPNKNRDVFNSRIEKMKKDIDRQIAAGITPENIEKIGLVGNSENAIIKELLNSKDADKYFEHMESPIDTQGLEKKYYIYVDSSFNNPAAIMNIPELFNNMDAFYTITSRSKQFTLIVNSDEYNGSITSEQDDNVVMSQYDINAIRSYNTSYTGIMNAIFDDLNKENVKASELKLSTIKTAKKPTVVKTPHAIETPGKIEGEEVHADVERKEGEKDINRPGTPSTNDTPSGDTEAFNVAGRQWDESKSNPLNNEDGGLATKKGDGLPEIRNDAGNLVRKMTDKEKAISDASESNPEEFLASGKENSYAGMIYSHAVDSMGSNVEIDYNNHIIHLDGYDSQGFNGVGKMLYILQEGGLLPSYMSVKDIGGSKFDIVFSNEDGNANIIMRSFIADTHKYLVAMRNALIAGRNSNENDINTKVEIMHELTNAYLLKITQSDSDVLKGTNVEFWFKKTDVDAPSGSGKARSSNLVPFQTKKNKVFESRMNVTGTMPRSAIVATVDLKGKTLIEIPIGTIENPATKLTQRDFEDGIVKWAEDNQNNPDAEISSAANAIIRIKNTGQISDSPRVADSIRVIENLRKLKNKDEIPGQIGEQADYIGLLCRVFIKNEPDVVRLDGDAREALGHMVSSGPLRRLKKTGYDYVMSEGYKFLPEPTPVIAAVNEGILDISDIYILRNDMTDNNGKTVISAGYPFVLVDINNGKINEPDMLMKYKEQVDSDVDYGLRVIYINPPLAGIEDFFNKLKAIFKSRSNKDGSTTLSEENKVIGNTFTAYRLIEALFLDKSETANLSDHVESVMKELEFNSLPSMYIPEEMAKTINVNPMGDSVISNSYEISNVISGIITYMKTLESNNDKNRMFDFLIKNNRYINYILSQLVYDVDASGNIKFDNTSDRYKNVVKKLNDNGIDGVFLNVVPDNGGWKKLGDSGIFYAKALTDGTGSYTMTVGGTSYPFAYFGKLETPCAVAPMGVILEAINKAYNETGTNDLSDNAPYRNRIDSYIQKHRNPFNDGPDLDGTVPSGVTPSPGESPGGIEYKKIIQRRAHQYPNGAATSFKPDDYNIATDNNNTFMTTESKDGADIVIVRQYGDKNNTELDFYIIKGGLVDDSGNKINAADLFLRLFNNNKDADVEMKSGDGTAYQIIVNKENNTISITPVSSTPDKTTSKMNVDIISKAINNLELANKDNSFFEEIFDEFFIENETDKFGLFGADGKLANFARVMATIDSNNGSTANAEAVANAEAIADDIVEAILNDSKTKGSIVKEILDIDPSELELGGNAIIFSEAIKEIKTNCEENTENGSCKIRH